MYISDYCIIKLKIIADGYDTIFSLFWKKGEGYPAPDYLWSVSVIRLINVRSVAEQLWIFVLGCLFPFWCNFYVYGPYTCACTCSSMTLYL